MAAWIGQYWQQQERRAPPYINDDDDDEVSRRRMVELMLGPFIASKPPPPAHVLVSEQPTTLDLLSAANTFNKDNMGGCTHVELEPEMPLPSGWEKCLHLKTGSIYYLNRTTGATSALDPRKQASLNKVCSRADLSSSPTTSELTVEVSNEAISNSNVKNHHNSLDANEKPKHLSVPYVHDERDLDLNLTLHVGLCSSPKPATTLLPRDVGVLSLHPPNPISPSKIKVSTNASVPSTASSSSSSSSTSSPSSASLAFSQTILSSKELSQSSSQERSSFFKQESNQSTRFPMKGSSLYGDLHHSLSDYVRGMGEGGRKPAEGEELSSTAMVTVACANCLMFVMLSRSNPKCPRCGTSCPEQMDFPLPPLKKAKLGFSF